MKRCMWSTLMFAAVVATAMLSAGITLAGKGGKGGGGTSYNIIKLDDSGGTVEGFAYDINNSRLIVGTAQNATDDFAACWTVNKVGRSIESTLHFLDGGDAAFGCNEAGEIVGLGNEAPVYWEDRNSPGQVLPALSGSERSSAEAISNDGVICGWSSTSLGVTASALVWRVTLGDNGPEVWGPLELQPLDPDPDGLDFAIARDVSDQDENGVITIAGESNDNAATWTVTLAPSGGLVAGSATILPPGFGVATGVNNTGMHCGRANLDTDTPNTEAVAWIDGIPRILDIGRSTRVASPTDINDEGVIVGNVFLTGAVVWSSPDATMVEMNKFLKNSPFDSLARAHAVSQAGEIVGYGWINDTQFHPAFLAIPK